MAPHQEDIRDIARKLEEGWHYRPDWRSRIVDLYFARLPGDSNEILTGETDPYIRQMFLYRRTRECLARESFAWAYSCHVHNRETGAASIIKAMTVAGQPVEEIATRLKTNGKSVNIYRKLYFDVLPYLEDRTWLASIIFAPSEKLQTLEEFREKLWLAAAYRGGQEELERAISPTVTIDRGKRDILTSEIQNVLAGRAHQYVTSLELGHVPATAQDFDRYAKMQDVMARQPVPEKNQSDVLQWIRGIDESWQAKCAAEEVRTPQESYEI